MKKAVYIVIGISIFLSIILFGQYTVSSISYNFGVENKIDPLSLDVNIPDELKTVVYPKDEVVEIKIYIEEDQFEYMSKNASKELYVPADIVYNGVLIENVGIRPKGNSSLMSAVMAGDDQYSLKVSINEFVDQNFYGLEHLNLNNLVMDPTYVREPLGYELMDYMGVPAPQTTYCNVYINDELFGLYLSVQQIDSAMMDMFFKNGDGEIYKPDGIGANLVYIDDKYDSYSGLIEKTNVSKKEEKNIVNMIDIINNGGDIEEVLDVDMVLKYHAVNAVIINQDCYAGGMFHNYYIYGEDGKYMVIPWDYNLTFMPFSFGKAEEDIDVTKFLIDEPTSGPMKDYPLVNALLTNEKYLDKYHGYIEDLLNGPLEEKQFTNRVYNLYELIDPYILADSKPQSSYKSFIGGLYDDYDYNVNNKNPLSTKEKVSNDESKEVKKTVGFDMNAFGKDVPSLIDFIQKRTNNIKKQLAKEIASTNNGLGNKKGKNSMMGGGFGDKGLNMGDMFEDMDMELFRKQMENMDMEEMQKQMESFDPEQMKDGGGFPPMPGSGDINKMEIPEGMTIFDVGNMILGKKNMDSIYSIVASFIMIIVVLIFRRKTFLYKKVTIK
ncbi:MAG: CotH kinase family protein [Clostridiales bacterium]